MPLVSLCLTKALKFTTPGLSVVHAAAPTFHQSLKSICDAHRYMVEHMRHGAEPSLKVHCRDEPFCRTGGRKFVINDIPDGAAGRMVITRYSMEESLHFWETEVIPHVAKFCRVLSRLFFDKLYQRSFMRAENQEEWYAEYADDA